MPIVESGLAPLSPLQVPQLAAAATSRRPAWLWSADGSRIVWANPVGAAIFGAATAAECEKRRFAAGDPAAAQIVRVAATLASGGQQRLARLRGFGAGFGRALTCACSRVALPDGRTAVLIAAAEPAGPSLPLGERVRRLFSDVEDPLAAFTPDGKLLHANAAALAKLGGATTLSALGLEALAGNALESGQASGSARFHQTDVEVGMQRLGKDESRVLLLTLPMPPIEPGAKADVAEESRRPGESAQVVPAAETPPAPAPSAATVPAAPPAAMDDRPVAERRHPLRFVWHMDADGRFIVGSDEFIELVGPRTIAACGRHWSEIAAELKLDNDNLVAHAVATRETWSSISVSWPVDGTDERLPVELSGLPVFDRDRAFRGYRGFGVCRDLAHINELARARLARPIGFMPAPQAPAAHDHGEIATAPNIAAASAPVAALAAQAVEAGATTEHAASPAPQLERPAPGIAAANVVPFRAGAAPEAKAPSLSAVERSAFRELAQELTARLRGNGEERNAASTAENLPVELPAELPAAASHDAGAAVAAAQALADVPPSTTQAREAAPQEPQQPAAEHALLDRVPAGILVYRDRALFYANRRFLELSGHANLQALAAAGGLETLFAEPGAAALTDSGGAQKLSIRTARGDELPVEGRLFTLPWNGTSALALILTSTEAEERHRAMRIALDSAHNEIGELKSNLERTARREAQKSAAAKADFLAKVSHEIRTPLNSIIGFAEVIMAERFGSIGNERYREYLKDMHAAGTHLVALLNDLLDLSKIETGQLDLTFANVELNDLTQQCVAVMQPQANRARIIIRSALLPGLPEVVADARSLRQIVLNLLAHAIKFTGPGGQVIVSTALADGGEAALRVRDTGVGMRQSDLEAVLDPLRQTAISPSWGSGGSGLGLPLTKALAEANRAHFSIKSAPNAGTLVEIVFPSSRPSAH